MSIVAPPTLTPAGLSPDRADRPTFVARSIARDDFIKNTQIPELQLALANVYNNATEAFNAGVQAALDAAAAEVSAEQAAAAAGAPLWVSGTSYVIGNPVWSPVTRRVYRCILATSGTTDPSLDVTHWSPIYGVDNGFKPLSAITTANTVVITMGQCSTIFRPTTLATGAPVQLSNVSPLTLTIPQGATLGSVNAVAARFIVLELNNAGTKELAVVNQSGGVDLSEMGLISTTAISAGATSASVVYSTTARTGVAYRVLGCIDSTQTVAGTYAAAPSLVQSTGGQALAAMSSLGYGQTWQELTGSRAVGTTYYNTTGKPFTVTAQLGSTAASSQALMTINGVLVRGQTASTANTPMLITAVIPIGGSYVCSTAGGTASVSNWQELR